MSYHPAAENSVLRGWHRILRGESFLQYARIDDENDIPVGLAFDDEHGTYYLAFNERGEKLRFPVMSGLYGRDAA